jgi:hypothetical protein
VEVVLKYLNCSLLLSHEKRMRQVLGVEEIGQSWCKNNILCVIDLICLGSYLDKFKSGGIWNRGLSFLPLLSLSVSVSAPF